MVRRNPIGEVLNIFVQFFFEDAERIPNAGYEKIGHISLSVLSFLIWNSYIGVLFSLFAVQQFGPPFNNVKEIIADGSYNISSVVPYTVGVNCFHV